MQILRVNYGGSHRANQRCREKLAPFRVPDSLDLPFALGSKRRETKVYDSPEMRAVLKAIGGSVSRRQWT